MIGLIVLVAVACVAILAFPAASGAAPASVSSFGFAPPVPLVGETVTFTAVGLPETGAELLSYRWDLDGDGSFELNTGLVPTATATYTAEQTITVRVQMRDTWDNRITESRVLTVGGQPPEASFIFAPVAPVVNQPVLFISRSSDPDGTIVDQAWDLNGDGVFDNGGGPSAQRSFAAPGIYVIGLRVTDDETHASFSSQTVSVGAAPITPGRSGQAAGLFPRLLSPFPVVRISGSLTRRGARLKVVAVDAPTGAIVRVRCKGRSCPYRTRTSVVSKRTGGIRLGRLERRLRAGVRVQIFVTSPNTIGKYTAFTIRHGKSPHRRDSCVLHGSSQPIACPNS
jgi:hypothetical protein